MAKYTFYTEELADHICSTIAGSSKSMIQLCREFPEWPNRTVIFDWLNKHPYFRDRYMLAKEQQTESLIDDILDIADNAYNDYIVNEDGKKIVDKDHINRARLRVDTRKWIASKMKAKKYGAHIHIESNSDDKQAEIKAAHDQAVSILNKISNDQS